MYLVGNQRPPQKARGEYFKRGIELPAPTLTSQVTELGKWSKDGDRSAEHATRITTDEAAVLQSYPRGFEFVGNKGSVGLQIGNAVPPLLARRVLEALWMGIA